MKYFILRLVLSILGLLFIWSIAVTGVEFGRLFTIQILDYYILANVVYIIALISSLFIKDHFIVRIILTILAFGILLITIEFQDGEYIWTVGLLGASLFMLTFYFLDKKKSD